VTAGARVGKNEAIFREVNERIQDLNRGFSFGADDITDFVCECSDQACFLPVRLTLGEYEQVRSEPTHFLIAPGHVWHPEVESVIRSTDRFEVVEKRGEAGGVAEEADPRS
jgi:hypothetical protein